MVNRFLALTAVVIAMAIIAVISIFSGRPSEAIENSKLLGTDQFRQSLASDLRNAKQSIIVTTYLVEAYPDNIILDELEGARIRGVEVRLMMDYRDLEEYPTILQDLQFRNIPFKVISGHAKVAVIDKAIAYVGSSNLNRNGLQDNWELDLRSVTPSTVDEAYRYLDLLWKNGRKTVIDKDYSPERFVNGDEFYDLMITGLQKAHDVKMLTYVTSYSYLDQNATDSKVFNELKSAHDRGATLQIMIDDSEYQMRNSAQNFLLKNNVPHRLDENGTEAQILHAKAVLFDDKVLFIGSHNMDEHSLNSAQEVSIMTSDPKVISAFLEIFDEKWDFGYSPDGILGNGNSTDTKPEVSE